MAAWSTQASDMFIALRANAKNGARVKKGDLSQAANNRKTGNATEKSKAVRDLALVGRALTEIWRNGWEIADETGATLLSAADAAVTEAIGLDDELNSGNISHRDYYPLWKRGYVARYRARSAAGPDDWAAMMTKSLQSYDEALNAKGVTPHARRSIRVDQAETLVYFGAAKAAAGIIEDVLRENYHNDRNWHVWALAFALHHAGEPDHAVDQLKSVLNDNDTDDLYNNDMRLMLAATHRENGDHVRAEELMQKFKQVQTNKLKPIWTLAHEIERGAFQPGSALEGAWQTTLTEVGLG